jgi:hypothetical protein
VPTANHQVFDLKQVKAKSTVVVTLKGNAANVRLLDTSGYSAFKAGRSHNVHGGGLVKKSPHRMVVQRPLVCDRRLDGHEALRPRERDGDGRAATLA